MPPLGGAVLPLGGGLPPLGGDAGPLEEEGGAVEEEEDPERTGSVLLGVTTPALSLNLLSSKFISNIPFQG